MPAPPRTFACIVQAAAMSLTVVSPSMAGAYEAWRGRHHQRKQRKLPAAAEAAARVADEVEAAGHGEPAALP